MQNPGKIENVKKKIHARARKCFSMEKATLSKANGSGRGEVGGTRKKFSGREGGAEGQVKL